MNMGHYHHILLILMGMMIATAISPMKAQQTEQDSNTEQNGVRFDQILNTFYYQDPLGMMINAEALPADGNIDTDSYILGPNDVLSIEINANNDFVLRAIPVNSQGDIVTPILGTIKVSGLTIEQAKQALQEQSDQIFRSSEVELTLDRAKNITFFVSGDVDNPGKHTLPAFSRVFDAIILSLTGTADNNSQDATQILSNSRYSFRNISVLHADGSTSKADLIAFLKAGYTDKNPRLRLGDRINLKTLSQRSPRVSISGSVIKPQEIEYSESADDTVEINRDEERGKTHITITTNKLSEL